MLEKDEDDLSEETDAVPNIDRTVMDEYSKKFGFVDWFLTSAKENTNLEAGTRRLVEMVQYIHLLPIANLLH